MLGIRAPDIGPEGEQGQIFIVFTLRDGLIVEIQDYLVRGDALAAAGAADPPGWRYRAYVIVRAVASFDATSPRGLESSGRRAIRVLAALALLAAGALVVRGAGQVLPEQLAMFPALALVDRPAGSGRAAHRRAGRAAAAGDRPRRRAGARAGRLDPACCWSRWSSGCRWPPRCGRCWPPPLSRSRWPGRRGSRSAARRSASRWRGWERRCWRPAGRSPCWSPDALFHAGRVRKLVDLHDLSFGGLSAYQDGHVHAGYAFPIVHAAEAGAVELAGVDPSVGFLALVPACAFLVPAAVYAAGRHPRRHARRRSPRSGSSSGTRSARRAACSTPASSRAASSFRIVIPVCIALIVEAVRLDDEPRTECALRRGRAGGVLAHPTYVMPVLAMVTAAVIARRGRGWRAMAGAYAASGIVLGVIWLAAIRGTGGAAGTRLDPGGFGLLAGHPLVRDGDIVIEGRLAVLLGLLAIPVVIAAWRGTHALAGAIGAGALAVLCLPGLPALLAPLIGPHQVGRLRGALPWPELLALLLVLIAATWPGRVWWIAAALAAASLGVAWLGRTMRDRADSAGRGDRRRRRGAGDRPRRLGPPGDLRCAAGRAAAAGRR